MSDYTKNAKAEVGAAEQGQWRLYNRHDGRRTWHACSPGDDESNGYEQGQVASLCLTVSFPVGSAGSLEQPDAALLPHRERVCGLCTRRIAKKKKRPALEGIYNSCSRWPQAKRRFHAERGGGSAGPGP